MGRQEPTFIFPHEYNDTDAASLSRTLVPWSAFCAHGTCDEGRQAIKVVLSNKAISYTGSVLKVCPPLWAVLFTGVVDGEYQLDFSPTVNAQRPCVTRHGIRVAVAQMPTPKDAGPTIQHPLAADSPVSTSFFSWGTAQSNVSGQFVLQNGGAQFNGVVFQQPSGMMATWYISFSVDPGQGTLTVTDAGGLSATSTFTTQ